LRAVERCAAKCGESRHYYGQEKEGKENYIVGGEESFGLMIGDKVRDKDSVSAVALICEMAAYEKENGKTLFDKLIELYIQYGFYYENLISITKKGMNGQKEIADMMEGYRNNPPAIINGSKVAQLLDYELSVGKNLITGESWKIELPKSNVLQFITDLLTTSGVLNNSSTMFQVAAQSSPNMTVQVAAGRAYAPYSKFRVEPGKKYFVNVGSVGQPRDRNPKAAYVVYDLPTQTIELRRLDYQAHQVPALAASAAFSGD
jgi:hypothetical protein